MSESIKISTFSAMINIDDYEKVYLEGKGSFAKVFLVRKKSTGEQYAAKVSNIDMNGISTSDKNDLCRELNIIFKISHPAILKFYGYSLTDFKNRNRIVMITKYIQNGTLRELITKANQDISNFDWNITKKLIIIYGIASGMSFLHSHDIIYRDLKPENILIDEYLFPKICDFGLSKSLREISNSFSGFKGTLKYAAPEALDNESHTKACDVYSFSYIVYEIITGNEPFPSNNVFKLYEYANLKKRPELNDMIPESYKELIKKCWEDDPAKRPSFDQIVERLRNDRGFITDDVDENEYIKYIEYIDKFKKKFDETNPPLILDNIKKRKSIIVKNYKKGASNVSTNSPKVISNSPKINSNSPKINSNSPKINSNSPNINSNSPNINSNSPKSISNSPIINSNSPKANPNSPNINPNSPKANSNSPKANPNLPRANTKLSPIVMPRFAIDKHRIGTRRVQSSAFQKIININFDSSDYSYSESQYDDDDNDDDYDDYDYDDQNQNESNNINDKSNEDSQNLNKNETIQIVRNPEFNKTLPYINELNNLKGTPQFFSQSFSSIPLTKTNSPTKNTKNIDPILYPADELNKLPPKCQELVLNASFNPRLQFILATNLINGENDFPKNSHLGIQYLRHSINYNYVDSILYYCEILTKGPRIVPPNVDKAKKLLKKSFKLDDSRLYLFYARIMNKEKNSSDAKKYFQLASNEGNADAQYELGLIYLKKNITEKSIEYFQLSKSNGNKKAILFCNIADEMYDIQGFLNLPNETKNYFFSQIFNYYLNVDYNPEMNTKSIPIYIHHKALNLFYKNKTLENCAFDNLLKFFDKISIEIVYPSKKYENIFRIISMKKKNLKMDLKIIILITGIKVIKNKFGPDKNINRIIIDSSVQSIETELLSSENLCGCFSNCESLTEMIIHSSLSSIGKWTFSCSSIVQITIPKSVTVIEEGCFSCCKSLNNVIIPSSVTLIDNKAFYGCSSLTQIVIPSFVDFIGDNCFENCISLENISVNSSLVSIGEKAFCNCSSLKNFTIPSSIKTIGNLVFNGCNSLQYVKIPRILKDLVRILGIKSNVIIND